MAASGWWFSRKLNEQSQECRDFFSFVIEGGEHRNFLITHGVR